jgi:hypothetical protein
MRKERSGTKETKLSFVRLRKDSRRGCLTLFLLAIKKGLNAISLLALQSKIDRNFWYF